MIGTRVPHLAYALIGPTSAGEAVQELVACLRSVKSASVTFWMIHCALSEGKLSGAVTNGASVLAQQLNSFDAFSKALVIASASVYEGASSAFAQSALLHIAHACYV